MGTSGQLCEGCFPKLSLSTRHVGDTYSDLGATITAPAQDKKPRNQNLPQRKTRERYRHRHVAIAHSDCSLSVPFWIVCGDCYVRRSRKSATDTNCKSVAGKWNSSNVPMVQYLFNAPSYRISMAYMQWVWLSE